MLKTTVSQTNVMKMIKPTLSEAAHKRLHKAMHGGHTFFHCLYLAAVSIEAHGFYGKAAIALLAVIVIGIVTGDGEVT